MSQAGPHGCCTDEMVVDALGSRGVPMARSYLRDLRTGVRTNPHDWHVHALATFFGVSAGYFFDEERPPELAGPADPRPGRPPAFEEIVLELDRLPGEMHDAVLLVLRSLRST